VPLRGWEQVVYRYTLVEALDEGVLVPWRPVYATAAERAADVVEAAILMIRRAAPPGPGLVSARDTADADAIAEALNAADIPAVAVHSKVRGGAEEVNRRLDALMSGRYRCAV